MANQQLGFGDFMKEAFRRRAHVPVLGSLPLNYLLLAGAAVLGLANPGFWLLGIALEVSYLFGKSTSARFQKLVQGERLLAAKKSWEEQVQEAVDQLEPSSRERYHRLLTQCQRILGISETLDSGGLDSLRQMRTGGLNQMLWIFLRMLSSREILAENLARIAPEALEKDIAKLEKRLGGLSPSPDGEPDSALVRSLRGTLEIQQRRLENLERSRQSLAVIDAELERIEHQVVLLREESAMGGKAEFLSSRLDTVTDALGETNRWLEQNAGIFGELGADPLGQAPADLPELAMSAEKEG